MANNVIGRSGNSAEAVRATLIDAALVTYEDALDWNAAAEAITGFGRSEALHQSFPQLTEAHGPLGKPLDAEYSERAIRDGSVSSFDLELKTARGAAIWLNVSVLVFEPLRFSPALIVHLAHDITASRRRRAPNDRVRETAREITQFGDGEHHLVPVPLLTQQEQRLLSLFAQGKTPAQVARELDISSQTLRNHLYHVNQKLGTHNRLEAVIHAVRRGLI
jgi:PAS domain S-box-containing protein